MFISGYQIKIVEGPGTGRVIPLTGTEINLGRAVGAHDRDVPGSIMFHEATVSRLHARLLWNAKQNLYVLQHCSKTNHTKVNDRLITEKALIPGDKILIGKLLLEVQIAPKTGFVATPEPEPEPIRTESSTNDNRWAPRQTQASWLGPQEPPPAPPPQDMEFLAKLPPDLEGWGLGQFVLGKELGRGSVGRVYLARHESLNLDRAIKILSPEATLDPDFINRFQSEARIAASLRHPNIIQVLDICMAEGLCYLVMEYLGSRSMLSYLEEAKGPQPVPWVVSIMDQLLGALNYAHNAGVIHRDVKPANILIDESRNTIALTDFSIAKVKDGIRETSVGVVLGTLEYMAPELFDGHPADPRADLYAVGVILYEVLTGIRPFRGKTNSEIIKAQLLHTPEPLQYWNPQVPDALAELTIKALSKNQEDRFATAQEMREAILQVFYKLTSPQRG